MDRKIALGIIGIGNIGNAHITNVVNGKCPDFALAAVADINSERIKWFQEKFSSDTACFSDAIEMLDSGLIEACIVCVPHYDHAKYAMECMKRGIHVMVEKPAGVYTKQVEDDVTIYAKYKNGATGVFITSTGEYPGTNRLEISGDRGKIILENSVLKWWKLAEAEREFCYSSQESFPTIDCDYEEFVMDEPETGHVGILQNFTNAILYEEELISPGEDGINELAISNAAYLSEWKGNVEITLPFDNKEFDELLAERSAVSKCKREELDNCTQEQQKRWQVRW